MAQSVEDSLIALLTQKGASSSLNPNDLAKALSQEAGGEEEAKRWRRYLPKVRQAALNLARIGQVEILRKGKPVEPFGLKGIYRIRIKSQDQATPISDQDKD